MLTAEYCLRRAERFRLKMLVTDDPAIAMRMRAITENYRRLADRALNRDATDAAFKSQEIPRKIRKNEAPEMGSAALEV